MMGGEYRRLSCVWTRMGEIRNTRETDGYRKLGRSKVKVRIILK